MKSFLRIICTVGLGFGMCLSQAAAQTCPTDYSSASLNWDALDYFPTAGYTGYPATATMSPNQNFAFGKNKLNISYLTVTTLGESTKQTGKTGSYAQGADLEFSGNGTITLTFASPVYNLKFSIQDVEKAQRIDMAATNAGSPQNIVLKSCATTGSILTINSTSATNPFVTSLTGNGPAGAADNATNVGSFNVDIAGPVTTVTIQSSNNTANTDFFISDIAACTYGGFPNNYYQVSRPFTNQPGYVLVSANKSVYMVDPATGNAKFIFSDGATSGTINSLAYDPYNKIIYYTWSLTNNGAANASERTVRKYDFNTGMSTTLVNDINTLGVPTFDQGVESGAAAFYDGALYIGIEGGADDGNGGPRTKVAGRESIIWRIDFSGTNAVSATQVFGVDGDSHDWSDFSLNNGVLYDFNGDASAPDYHHFNLLTGENILKTWSTVTPKQSAVGWDGKVYWVSNQIAEYNLNGGVGARFNITANPAIPNFGTSSAPSFGDAAEAFRPRLDFGDAPASFDPDPLAPAVHDTISTLRLGANTLVEWNRTTNVNTDTDDDGLTYARILNTAAGNYETEVRVYNNTGVSATLAAWVDFNGDGTFQSEEGIVQPVPSSTTTQTISLYWSGIISTLPANSSTYLRVRLTTASGLSKTTPTGYFANGEVEDYYVPVNSTVLAVKLDNFSAQKSGEEYVSVNWSVKEEKKGTNYVLQQSNDGSNWKTIYTTIVSNDKSNATYSYIDAFVHSTQTFYRLQITEPDGSRQYSKIEKVDFSSGKIVKIYPNPTSGNTTITVTATNNDIAKITLVDIAGEPVFAKAVPLQKGKNSFTLPVASHLPEGVYTVQVALAGELYIQKLLVTKNQ